MSELARRAGLPQQSVSEYLSGRKKPGSDALFALADATGHEPRYLLTGEGERFQPSARPDNSPVTIAMERFDLYSLGEYGRGLPKDKVAVPVEWLFPVTRGPIVGLWLCDVPDGPTLVCREPDQGRLMDKRLYIVVLDGRPSVRRVTYVKNGLLLTPMDDDEGYVSLEGEEATALVVLARVLAQITLEPA